MIDTPNDALTVEERVGQFGLQEDEDTIDFFTTREGLKVLGEIAAAINEDVAEEEKMAILLAEEAQRDNARLWGALEEAFEDKEARQIWREVEEAEHTNALLHHSEIVKSKTDTIEFDPQYVELLEVEHERIKTTSRYDNYDKNINDANAFVATLEHDNKPETIDKLQNRIARLEKTNDAEAEVIHKLVDKGEYEQARSRLDSLNAKNLQIGTLKDMMSVTKGDKEMYNNNGEQVQSFKDADFVVARDKKIVKEGEQYYLLGKDQQLTYRNRGEAKEAFLYSKSQMSSVKNLVSTNRGIEMGALDADVSRLNGAISARQEASVVNSPMMQPMPDSPQSPAFAETLHAEESGFKPTMAITNNCR